MRENQSDQSGSVVRVVKVGGSLFQDSQFAIRLRRWLNNSRDESENESENESGNESGKYRNVLIAGGGRSVDCVRDWYRKFQLTEDHSHDASIRMMSETARLLAALLKPVSLVTSIHEIRGTFADCENLILDCQKFMESESRLERSWRSTSDSIAAEIAVRIQADELWLLKSTQPSTRDMTEWQKTELVDQNFAQTAEPLKKIVIANFGNDDLLSVEAN